MKLNKQLKFVTIIFFTNLFLFSYPLIKNSFAVACVDDASNSITCDGQLNINSSGETIANTGIINASSSVADIRGINGVVSNATIINSGTINTTTTGSYNARGIGITGDYATITNSGIINSTASAAGGSKGARGIGVAGDYATITNAGTINSTALGSTGFAYGIGVFGNNTLITNTGIINASAEQGDVRTIAVGTYNNVAIINAGTINATASATYDARGIGTSGAYATITNSGTINSTTIGGIARAIGASGNYTVITNTGIINAITSTGEVRAIGVSGDNTTIINSGIINATSTSVGSVYSVFGIRSGGADTAITNSGTITVSTDGDVADAFGIASGSDTNTITNSGTITVSASGASANAYGITSDGDTNTITNSGTITVSTSGNNLEAIGIYSFGNTNTITNSGTITASTIGTNASAYGITSYGTDNTITNSGTITVSTKGTGADAFGIYNEGNTNTITNSGKITAANAIYSNGDGGSLNILPNSYIDGAIRLLGDTTVNITTGPSHSIYYNLGVTPTFSGPTPGFINGTIAATFDPTVFKGSINELADLNNNIASTANKNLSNFKDRQFSTSVFASQLEHKADAVNLKQEIDQLGVVFAYDYKLADTNLNFMAGYANSDLEANSRFAKSYANKTKGPFIGVAGIYDAGLVNVNFGLTTGLLKHSHDRFVNDNEATNGEAHAKANYDSMFIAPEIGVSKKIKSNDITFSPKANVRYNYQSVDGYTETGSNSNATVKSLDIGLVETNLELAGTKSLNDSSYTIRTGYLNRQSVGDHKATVTMIGQTNSIGVGDKSNNIYYAGVGADFNLANFKLSLDLNQYLGDSEGFQGMIKLTSAF